MKPSNNKTGKLSHLIRAGAIIHTVDGGVFRCTSKVASSDGVVKYRLANLQGKPVTTPADFRPISHALARFAAFMRLAFNPDFDLYVKEYIKAAGLPIDPTMDWSKFFAARIAPKLMSTDDEVRDEAIHQIIIKTLVERNALSNFSEAIKKFPERIQNLPLERQVTTFLMQTFNWRIREANDYIKEHIYQDETSSMWQGGEDEGEDVNLLDTEDYGSRGGYDAADADIDIEHFRKGFEIYLKEKFREDTVNQYLSIFDLLYAHLREGDLPRGADIYAEWKDGVGAGLSSARFKILYSNLPKIIDTYVTKNLDEDNISPFVDIMRQIGQERKEREPELQPIMGGLKLAEEFPTNHEIAPEPSDSGSGGGGGFSLPSMGDMGEVGEAASGAGEIAELAPLVALASKKEAAQWEVPKCKSCGGSQDTRECPACHEKFCGDHLLDHHANNPSHDRVASKSAAIPVDRSLNIKDLIEDVIGSGLFEQVGNHYFSWDGCDYCHSNPEVAKGHQGGEGADVTDYKGFRSLTDAQAPNREDLEYEFKLCDDCLNKLYYGDMH